MAYEIDEEGNKVRTGYHKWINEGKPLPSDEEVLPKSFDWISNSFDYQLQDEFDEYMNNLGKRPEKKLFFVTIQDWNKRPEQFEDLVLFMKQTEYLFKNRLYAIETGGNKDDPHYHIHLLGNYVNPKNAFGKICIEWNKIFGEDLRADRSKHGPKGKKWFMRQHQTGETSKKNVPYNQWVQEKVHYIMDNNKKGEHANYESLLNLQGGWGVVGVALTSIMSSPPFNLL